MVVMRLGTETKVLNNTILLCALYTLLYFSAPTHNHKPQTTTRPPTTHNHHDEVRKNGIPYALGLTRSIAYRRNCLLNRNPDIVAEMSVHVGIK